MTRLMTRLITRLIILFVCLVPYGSIAQTLFYDDFNGTSLDLTKWEALTGAGSFLGRTQMRPTPPTLFNGVVRLRLDTYNPSAITPGDSFFGTDILTRQIFDRSKGLILEEVLGIRTVS